MVDDRRAAVFLAREVLAVVAEQPRREITRDGNFAVLRVNMIKSYGVIVCKTLVELLDAMDEADARLRDLRERLGG